MAPVVFKHLWPVALIKSDGFNDGRLIYPARDAETGPTELETSSSCSRDAAVDKKTTRNKAVFLFTAEMWR